MTIKAALSALGCLALHSAWGPAPAWASDALPTFEPHQMRWPSVSRETYQPIEQDFRDNPSAVRALDQVFGKPLSAPLADRRSMRVNGTVAIDQTEILAKGKISTWMLDCEAECIILLTDNSRDAIIYKEAAPAFWVLMRSAKAAASEELVCIRLWCPLRPEEFDNYELPQIFWMDAFTRTSFSYEPIGSDTGHQSMVDWALRLAARPTPAECKDTYDGGKFLVSACGVLRRHMWAGREHISYCRLQNVPGYEAVPEQCVPLFYRHGREWYYASVAARISSLEPSAGASSTCVFDGIANLSLAGEIASAFKPLFKDNLRVTLGGDGSHYIAGTQMNANFASVNRGRPWGYLKLAMHLRPGGSRPQLEEPGKVFLGISSYYTVSAQRFTKRTDGRELSEEEETRIEAYVWGWIRTALRRSGIKPNSIRCMQ